MKTGKTFPKSVPKCTRCRNHGLSVERKGHSGKCPFQLCTCWKCALITERTRIMTNQRRIRRTTPTQSTAAAAPVTGAAVPAGAQQPARPTTTGPGPGPEPGTRPAETAAYRSRSPDRGTAGVTAPCFTAPPQQLPLLLGFHHPDGFLYPAFLVNLQQPPPGETIGFPPLLPNVFTYPAAEARQTQEGPVSFYSPHRPCPLVLQQCDPRPHHYNMEHIGTSSPPSQTGRENQ